MALAKPGSRKEPGFFVDGSLSCQWMRSTAFAGTIEFARRCSRKGGRGSFRFSSASFSTNQGEHHEPLPRDHGRRPAVGWGPRASAKSGDAEFAKCCDARHAGADAARVAFGSPVGNFAEGAR